MGSADELVSFLKGVGQGSFDGEVERHKVRVALYAALRRVESPWDTALAQCWTEPINTAAIKTCIDAGLWKKWVAAGGKPSSPEDLSKISGMDSTLLLRMLRHMAGEGFVTSEEGGRFGLNKFSRELATDVFPFLYDFLYTLNQPIMANFPKFMADTKYSNPTDVEHGNFQSWQPDSPDLFKFFAKDPLAGQSFNKAMTYYTTNQVKWVDIYPTETIVANAKPGKPMVVDVGGNVGHDLERVRAKHPDVPAGSYVLQDLANVIESSTVVGPAAVAQSYDFFTPEPIHGARVYYLHSVLHDWPDVKVVEILKNIAPALEKGYSRILLHENVIKPRETHPWVYVSDMTMMTCVSAVERTEEMWNGVITQAGLKISKIWTRPDSVASIIEVELP